MFARRLKQRGVTLIELLVASALALTIMGLVWALIQTGGQFYLKVRSQSDIQRGTLLALRWMATDLAQGAPVSFRGWNYDDANEDPQPGPGELVGISFGSPEDTGGQVSYDASGAIHWKSVIGYYIDANPGNLWRSQIEFAPQNFPPIIHSGFHSPPIMATQPRPRKVADHIYNIRTVQGPGNIALLLHARHTELRFGLRVQTRLEMKN